MPASPAIAEASTHASSTSLGARRRQPCFSWCRIIVTGCRRSTGVLVPGPVLLCALPRQAPRDPAPAAPHGAVRVRAASAGGAHHAHSGFRHPTAGTRWQSRWSSCRVRPYIMLPRLRLNSLSRQVPDCASQMPFKRHLITDSG